MKRNELTVAQVANLVGCHRNTVLRYEKKGAINSRRDLNNFRLYPVEEALRLKKLLSLRTESPQETI